MNNILFADAIGLSVFRNSHDTFAKKRFRKALLPLIAIASLIFSLLLMTGVHVGTYIQGYSIAKLEQQQNDLLSNLQAYKLEETVLKRPERIRRMATHELRLIQPSKAPVIRLP